MRDDVDKLAVLLAGLQGRMDAAVGRATGPSAEKLAELSAAFRDAAAGALADARTTADAVAAALSARRDRPLPTRPPPRAVEPYTPPDDHLAALLRADWFGQFGHHEYPPEPG